MARSLLKTESTLTDRYQTTVPDAVRKALHLGKRDKICYTVQSDGHVLMSRAGEIESDPVMNDFLTFIANDMLVNPQNITPIHQDLFIRVQSLVSHIDIDLDEPLSAEENEVVR